MVVVMMSDDCEVNVVRVDCDDQISVDATCPLIERGEIG